MSAYKRCLTDNLNITNPCRTGEAASPQPTASWLNHFATGALVALLFTSVAALEITHSGENGRWDALIGWLTDV